jgi:predicted transglutaminase-like cysteine proteinase
METRFDILPISNWEACVLRTALRTAALAVFAILANGAATAQGRAMAYAQHGEESAAPIGWHMFCQETEGRGDCNAPALRATNADLDERRWRDLLAINARVNREIEPVTDLDHWGVAERWNYPTDGKGDCEDYVLEKRKRLMQAGFPRQALLITVVRDKKGDGHAVLMVRTDRGDFILDNQEQKVKLWTDTGYRYIKRQSQENPNRWVSLGNIDTAIVTANSGR